MDRGSTPAFQDEIVKSQNMPVHLLSVHLDSETVYMTDAYKNITYNGNEYIAVGHFLGFSDIEETTEVIVSTMTLSLSGVDQVWINKLLGNDYIDRPIKIYTAFLDKDTQALISDPVLIFEGHLDAPVINEDPDAETSIISASATNAWVDFTRITGRHTNNEEQQILFPGDKGFEFADKDVHNLVWEQ